MAVKIDHRAEPTARGNGASPKGERSFAGRAGAGGDTANGIWDPAARIDGIVPDPMGVPTNRSLGLLIAGDDSRSHIRGSGRTSLPQTRADPHGA